MSFEKGQKGGPGRPKGSKDKVYLKLEYWYNELMKDWSKLRPSQRTKLSAQMMQMITNKLKQLPSDPQESARNVEESMKLLEELEKGVKNSVFDSNVQKNEVNDSTSIQPPESAGK